MSQVSQDSAIRIFHKSQTVLNDRDEIAKVERADNQKKIVVPSMQRGGGLTRYPIVAPLTDVTTCLEQQIIELTCPEDNS